MLLSKILPEIGIEANFINEKSFDSLGLAGYNAGVKVCTFIEDQKYISSLSDGITIVITNEKTANAILEANNCLGICVVKNPRTSYFKVHNYLSKLNNVLEPTTIGEGCFISTKASIADNNVKIGNNVVIEDFAVINEGTVIGDNSIIHAGTIIGGQGFEYKKTDEETFFVEHVGGVSIGKNVDIHYNTCVDRAIYPWDQTVIGDDVKIDNLVHVAHGVKIGKGTMVIANVGIGGRTTIGENGWLGFGCTIRNGITIGNNVRVNMGAVVTKSIEDGQSVTGNFAIEHSKFIENLKQM